MMTPPLLAELCSWLSSWAGSFTGRPIELQIRLPRSSSILSGVICRSISLKLCLQPEIPPARIPSWTGPAVVE